MSLPIIKRFLLGALFICLAQVLSASNCVRFGDLGFNPIIINQKALELNKLDVEECYDDKNFKDIIEKNIIIAVASIDEDTSQMRISLKRSLQYCLNNEVKGDTLAFIYYLYNEYLQALGFYDTALLYIDRALKFATSEKCFVLIKSSQSYLRGRDELNDLIRYEFLPSKEDDLDFYYSILLDLVLQSNYYQKEFYKVLDEIDLVEDQYLKIMFLITSTTYRLREFPPKQIQELENRIKIEISDYDGDTERLNALLLLYQSRVKNVLQDYTGSFEYAKKFLDAYNVNTEDIEKSLNRVDHKHVREALFNYTKSLLYLTRTGEGISPVKEAYDIYIQLIEYGNKKPQNFNRSKNFLPINFKLLDNILVIAGYLSQKTGDLSYVSRAYSALDALKSRGVRAATFASSRIRRGGKLGRLLQENKILNRELFLRTEYALDHPEEDLFTELLEMHQRQIELGAAISEQIPAEESVFAEKDITTVIEQLRAEVLTDTSGILLLHSGSHQQRMLITKDTILFGLTLGRGEKLTDFTDWWKRLAGTNDTLGLVNQSREMYQRLLSDFNDYLPRRLHIVANGLFESFPFAALRSDSSGAATYFGEEHQLSYHYSLRTLLTDQDAPALAVAAPKILAMAPDFNSSFQYVSRNRSSEREEFDLAPLGYNGLELQALAERFRGSFYEDDAADKPTFLEQAGEHGVLHLATHALADAGLGERSAFFLSSDDPSEPATSCRAGEISQLQLDADLVVLSACETGLGSRLSSEGTVGLTRAFSSAGARGLLSTLWAVDDRTTAEIVIDFYDQLKTGATKSEALLRAQANYRNYHAGTEKAQPYYWAAFVLVGNDDPIEWLGAGASFSFWWIVAGLGLISLFFIYQKNKA